MAIVTEKVLVVKTSSLGDIMHGLQLAQTLKENDPGIEITWVVRSRFEPLVQRVHGRRQHCDLLSNEGHC